MENIDSAVVTTVICIPGPWATWNDFMHAIIEVTKGEYMAAASILLNTNTKKGYTIEFYERDERMAESFKFAGMVNRVSEAFVEEIDSHQNVIYISGPTGSLEEAEHIAFAAGAVLQAGGLGVKVETAGKAFEKEQWQELLDNFGQPNLYRMFVIDSIREEDGTVFSCGMHNLGFKDTIISGEEFQDAVSLISIFGYYQVVESPAILDQQTFGADAESPRYIITEETEQPYEGHELFGNPFGMWRLGRI